jgi:hypothetical protein
MISAIGIFIYSFMLITELQFENERMNYYKFFSSLLISRTDSQDKH